MEHRAYLDAYLDAQNTAQSELEQVSEELNQLWIRKGQLERAVETLPTLADPEERLVEINEIIEQSSSAPVESQSAPVVPTPGAAAPDPETALHVLESALHAYVARSESPRDAMQRRIDSALGLKVA